MIKMVRYAFYILKFYFVTASTPLTLKKQSLDVIATNIQNRSLNIILKKIYPNLFDANIPLQNSGFIDILFREIPYNKEVNLSHLNL